jgi:hypothetical protein
VRLGASVVILCACNRAFGLDPTQAIDAAPIDPDRDGDGVPNEQDLCPDLAEVVMHDEDGDAVGDTCDPCPLDAGTTGDADGDGIHDACDPGPQPHCLALFDSLASYTAADWDRVAGTVVTPGTDRIQVAGSPRGGVSPKGIAGKHSLRFRASVLALDAMGYVGIMGSTTVGNTDAGFQCRVLASELLLVNVVFGPAPAQPVSPPLAATESIVVTMARGGRPEQFGCRLERESGAPELSAAIQDGAAGPSVAITAVGSETIIVLDNLSAYVEGTGACSAPVIR